MTKRITNLTGQLLFNIFYAFRIEKTPIWGYCKEKNCSNFALSNMK